MNSGWLYHHLRIPSHLLQKDDYLEWLKYGRIWCYLNLLILQNYYLLCYIGRIVLLLFLQTFSNFFGCNISFWLPVLGQVPYGTLSCHQRQPFCDVTTLLQPAQPPSSRNTARRREKTTEKVVVVSRIGSECGCILPTTFATLSALQILRCDALWEIQGRLTSLQIRIRIFCETRI